MKRFYKIWAFLLLTPIVACTEDIVIDVEEGEPMIGVEASFTDELKCHETILSYTADFYNHDEIKMVSGATVYVTDGVDTIYYYEAEDAPGHYFTEPVAGVKNRMYHFCAEVPDENAENGILRLYAESYMANNVETIDSLVIKPYNADNDSVISVFFGDTIEWLYPHFQSLADPTIIYMPMISKNDTLKTDSLNMRMMIPVGGYAGYYINGPEMLEANKEIPIGYFRKSKLKSGDRIRADLYSIPMDYMMYFYTLIMSTGSNPMMGAPANVSTNIQPEGAGVGWFFTASVVSVETVFED